MTTQPPPESAEPAPVATDTQAREAGIVGGVTLELDVYAQLLSLARRALESESRPQSQGVPTGEVDIDLAVSRFLGRYGEPHRPWEEKDLVALLSERERLAYDMGRSQAAGDATCSGEWLSGSGGHRVFGGCDKPASWVETDGGAAACDEHLGQHVRAIEKAKKGKR